MVVYFHFQTIHFFINMECLFKLGLGLWCFTSLSAMFQLHCGDPFYWRRKPQCPENSLTIYITADNMGHWNYDIQCIP